MGVVATELIILSSTDSANNNNYYYFYYYTRLGQSNRIVRALVVGFYVWVDRFGAPKQPYLPVVMRTVL